MLNKVINTVHILPGIGERLGESHSTSRARAGSINNKGERDCCNSNLVVSVKYHLHTVNEQSYSLLMWPACQSDHQRVVTKRGPYSLRAAHYSGHTWHTRWSDESSLLTRNGQLPVNPSVAPLLGLVHRPTPQGHMAGVSVLEGMGKVHEIA